MDFLNLLKPTKKEEKTSIKDLEKDTKQETKQAIEWIAAEYKYLIELKKDLKEIETEDIDDEKKAYRKARRALRYIGRSQRKAGRSLTDLLKDLRILLKQYPELANISQDIEISSNKILKAFSFYVGDFKRDLVKILLDIRKKEQLKNPEKAKKDLDKKLREIQTHLDTLITWVGSLETSLDALDKKEGEILAMPLKDENIERAKQQGTGEIMVISDVHVAKSWDKMEEYLRDKEHFLNPNRELKKAIDIANSSKNIIAVINNGDIVDYFFANYVKLFKKYPRKRDENWELYHSMIARLKKPFYETLGNHDFRIEPYNYDIYGLKHVNIPEKQRREQIRPKGHHHGFRLTYELPSIFRTRKFNPLKYYQGFNKPQERNIGGYHCIFLNTGGDAYASVSSFGAYMKKIFTTGKFGVGVEGLKTEDIAFVQNILNNGNKVKNFKPETIYIFMHAPLISSHDRHLDKEYQLYLENFLKTAAKQGLTEGTILKKADKLLEILKRSSKNIIIIASHVHFTSYFLIDKNTLKAKEGTIAELNKQRNNPRYIKQVTTWPLGAIDGSRITGYLLITPSGFKEKTINVY